MLHRIAHWLHWNLGRVDGWTENGRTFVAFRCSGCGKRAHITDITADIDRAVSRGSPRRRTP